MLDLDEESILMLRKGRGRGMRFEVLYGSLYEDG